MDSSISEEWVAEATGDVAGRVWRDLSVMQARATLRTPLCTGRTGVMATNVRFNCYTLEIKRVFPRCLFLSIERSTSLIVLSAGIVPCQGAKAAHVDIEQC